MLFGASLPTNNNVIMIISIKLRIIFNIGGEEVRKSVLTIIIVSCLLSFANILTISAYTPVMQDWYVFYPDCPWSNVIMKNVYGVNFGVPYAGKVEHVEGVDFGLISSSVKNVSGLQYSIFANNSENVEGVEIAMLNNISESVKYFQFAGINNVNGEVRGGQIAVINNVRFNATGFQLGILNNVNGNMEGVQIGLINNTVTAYGIQFGLINVIKNGWIPFLPIVNFTF